MRHDGTPILPRHRGYTTQQITPKYMRLGLHLRGTGGAPDGSGGARGDAPASTLAEYFHGSRRDRCCFFLSLGHPVPFLCCCFLSMMVSTLLFLSLLLLVSVLLCVCVFFVHS